MYCLSVSHKSADIELRKKIAFSADTQKSVITELMSLKSISECVLLCTCGRTEVYFCGERGSEKAVPDVLCAYGGIESELLGKHLRFYIGNGAVSHLFKVACGIDSMVIGEDEILGQTKTAYQLAKELNAVSYELNMTFQAAFTCAKKIKTDTALSKSSCSVATLAANEAARTGEKVSVVVIGASGRIGSTVLKNLVSHKNVTVRATARSEHSKRWMAEELGVQAVDYNERYDFIQNADCVISATSSPHYTVTLGELKGRLTDGRDRLFIDLAVPPDIESSVTRIDGVRLMNIDHFEKLARENNALKLDIAQAALEMIEAEADALKKDFIFHDFLPQLGSIGEKIKAVGFEKLVYRMKANASAEAFSEFVEVLRGMQ